MCATNVARVDSSWFSFSELTGDFDEKTVLTLRCGFCGAFKCQLWSSNVTGHLDHGDSHCREALRIFGGIVAYLCMLVLECGWILEVWKAKVKRRLLC
jgi:hypothetical protein